MEQELKGKVAIVTGAGRMRSIGRPIAKLLAQAGAAVVITGTGRPPEHYPDDEKAAGWHDIESVAGEIRGAGGRCLTLISDVCDEQANDALIERAVAEYGRLDILINNASAARGPDRVPTLEMPYAVWKKVMVTNLDGTFLLSRAAARRMIAQGGGGSIVNISSIASKLAPRTPPRTHLRRRGSTRSAVRWRSNSPGTISASMPYAPASSTPSEWTTWAAARRGRIS